MSDVHLRAARPLDAGALGAIMGEANARLGFLPQLYSGAQEIGFVGDLIDAGWVRVAVSGDQTAGFVARRGGEIHALYLRPHLQGRGVARALIQEAQREVDMLGLWSYAQNARAARFYRKAGFVEVARSDGAGNDAHLPDIRFEWRKEPA